MDVAALAQALKMPPGRLGVLPIYGSVRPQFHLHGMDSVPSTSAALWDLMAQGSPAGTVVVATTQSAGRGQWGRQWQSSPGGLYLSLGLKPDLPTSASPHLTLASAWGIATGLGTLGIPIGLKWPNDLVVSGRKLGGILTETRGEQNDIRDVVIGVGINWSNPVPPTGINLRQIQATSVTPGTSPRIESLEQLAAIVLYGVLQGYFHLQTQGLETLIESYQTLLINVGQSVVVNGVRAAVTGINTAGNLRVKPIGARNAIEEDNSLELQPGQISLGYNA